MRLSKHACLPSRLAAGSGKANNYLNSFHEPKPESRVDQAQRIHPAIHRPLPFIGSLVDPLRLIHHCESGSWFACSIGRGDTRSFP